MNDVATLAGMPAGTGTSASIRLCYHFNLGPEAGPTAAIVAFIFSPGVRPMRSPLSDPQLVATGHAAAIEMQERVNAPRRDRGGGRSAP